MGIIHKHVPKQKKHEYPKRFLREAIFRPGSLNMSDVGGDLFLHASVALDIQTPAEKVFRPPRNITQNVYTGMLRVFRIDGLFHP